MDNEPVIDEQADPANSESNGLRLDWRVLLAVMAVVIIAILAYPFLQQQAAREGNDSSSTTSKARSPITGPEATAQANPGSAKAQFELGNTYVQSGQLEQAIAAYRRAIELDPNYQAAYANLGVVYYQQEKFDLAASQYQKALELDPDDGEVAYNLGVLYLQQALISGDQADRKLLDQAIAQLQRAMELAPDLAEPYFSLGVAYTALDRNEEAIQAFEAFLARDDGQDPRASQEAQRYLRTLRGQ